MFQAKSMISKLPFIVSFSLFLEFSAECFVESVLSECQDSFVRLLFWSVFALGQARGICSFDTKFPVLSIWKAI